MNSKELLILKVYILTSFFLATWHGLGEELAHLSKLVAALFGCPIP